MDEQLSYWRKQLDGLTVLELPTDKPRPLTQTYNGAYKYISIPTQVIGSLKSLSQQERATPFMILLASFKVLLSRYTNQKDIAIGTPITNRTQLEIEKLIGTDTYFLSL